MVVTLCIVMCFRLKSCWVHLGISVPSIWSRIVGPLSPKATASLNTSIKSLQTWWVWAVQRYFSFLSGSPFHSLQAIQGLNGMQLGDKKLVVQRASVGAAKIISGDGSEMITIPMPVTNVPMPINIPGLQVRNCQTFSLLLHFIPRTPFSFSRGLSLFPSSSLVRTPPFFSRGHHIALFLSILMTLSHPTFPATCWCLAGSRNCSSSYRGSLPHEHGHQRRVGRWWRIWG